MKLSIKAGTTSNTFNLFIQDSSSTVGAGLAGLTSASPGLTVYYALTRTAAVAITPAALTGPTVAWALGGFVAIDGTNMPGWYRIDLPDAMFAAATGRFANLHLKGAANMAPVVAEFELTGWDNQDVVRGGLSALPNAAAAAIGGLPTVDATNSVKIQTVSKKNQALSNWEFLMTDSTTHNPVPAKVVTVTRSIDGTAFAVGTLSAVTELSNGLYMVNLASADLNGTVVTLRATAAGCDDLFVTFLLEP